MSREINGLFGRQSRIVLLCLASIASASMIGFAQEDDYEFMPLHAWGILGATGDDDVTMTLAEGFPGHRVEPKKNRWIEPIDGDGGFDNVAPRFAVSALIKKRVYPLT